MKFSDLLSKLPPDEIPEISPDEIQAALNEGQALLKAGEALPGLMLGYARQHCVLATARALGVYYAATATDNSDAIALGELALGICFVWWGYFDEAASHLDAFYTTGSTSRRATLYADYHRLSCQRRTTYVADATTRYRQIADELGVLGDELGMHRCRVDAAITVLMTDGPEQANEIVKAALAYFEQHDLRVDLALARAVQARIAIDTQHLEDGYEWLAEAEAVFEQARAPLLVNFVWHQRGFYYARKREVDNAVHWLTAAYQRALTYRHPFYQIMVLEDLAELLRWQGDNGEAYEIEQSIQELAREYNFQASLANSHLRFGNYYFKLGKLDSARLEYERAAQLHNDMGNAVFAATALMDQGIVDGLKGRFSSALAQVEQALDVFTRHENPGQGALAHLNLGLIYANFGYIEPAIKHIRMGIDQTEQANLPLHSAKMILYLARLLLETDAFDEAEARLVDIQDKVGVAGLDEDVALCELVRGDIKLRHHQLDAARQHYRRSIDLLESLSHPAGTMEPRLGLAETYLEVQHGAAAERVLVDLDETSMPAHLRWRRLALQARLMKQRGQPREALETSIAALYEVRDARWNLDEEEHIQAFILALQPAFDQAFRLALDLPDPTAALIATELYGSQLLSTRLGELVSPARRDLTDLPADLSTQLNAWLGDNWTVLRYLWHKDNLWLFTLTPEGINYYAIPLLPQTRLALRMCASPDDSFRRFTFHRENQERYASGVEQRRRLFNVLLPESVKDRLGSEHTLIIVPSHQLHGLAFNTLLDGDAPLLERARVLIVQSLTQLVGLLDNQQVGGTLGSGLVMAQAEFPLAEYPSLPTIRREADAIRQVQAGQLELFSPADHSTVDIQRRGVSGEFAGYDWLHVATHAYADRATGVFTGLLLGDGIISLEDIREWELHARLITLSACQSGLGRWYYGDEIAGLSQAFFRTGAQNIVASLWRVEDSHTADLMQSFYAGLGDKSPLRALVDAQRAAHTAGLDPYYWAPFTTFGAPT